LTAGESRRQLEDVGVLGREAGDSGTDSTVSRVSDRLGALNESASLNCVDECLPGCARDGELMSIGPGAEDLVD
jgi:hypothetical protein